MLRILSLAALLAGAPAAAQAAAPDKASADKPDADKKICKREIATGSIMSRRTCHTKAEWDQLEARGKADLDRTRAMERSRSLVEGNR
ncbi:hypothetical protein [Sphingopyxis flava]|uniref:PsiF repeat-containing protein n=1 Tax=Sphingopyxis flava TaxID=1507287 RepID=A0A1T5AZC6_9SPHN|nr:hypothetical protein [Sphingopyxis flava]SKB40325.1 hypothetical protein SAMN06295937_100517 [Sphingopyxis flava]